MSIAMCIVMFCWLGQLPNLVTVTPFAMISQHLAPSSGLKSLFISLFWYTKSLVWIGILFLKNVCNKIFILGFFQSVQHCSGHIAIFRCFIPSHLSLLDNKHCCGVVYLVVEVFILKLLPVDALTPGAILVGEVTSLDHETLDDCQNKETNTTQNKNKKTIKLLI